MKLKFKAKSGSVFSNDQACVYGKRLFELMKTKKREVTPHEVIEDAKNPKASYHNYFEWNDKKAGEKHRMWQARYLLNHIVVPIIVFDNDTKQDKEIDVRVFHSVTRTDVDGINHKGYVPFNIVFSDKNYSEQTVFKALRELHEWYNKYSIYSGLSDVAGDIRKHLIVRKILSSEIPA